MFIYFFLFFGLLCRHTYFVMQRLDFRQLSGRLQLKEIEKKLAESKSVFTGTNEVTNLLEGTTYILVAAHFFKSAVFVDKWSTVFLPLRGQIHHPLDTGLH